MAKISKLNVSITGDSTGLSAATDRASSSLRKFRMEQERTEKQLGAMRSRVNMTAEALSKFGIANRGIAMGGGALALASMGGTGLALGGIGAAMAGITAGIAAVGAAVDGMADERKRAVEAMKIINRAPFRRAEEFGFSRRALENLAGLGAGAPILGARGFTGGMQLGMAEGPSRFVEQMAQFTPMTGTGRGILGQTVGGILGGKSIADSARDAVRQGMRDVFAPGISGQTSGDLVSIMGLYNTLAGWWAK